MGYFTLPHTTAGAKTRRVHRERGTGDEVCDAPLLGGKSEPFASWSAVHSGIKELGSIRQCDWQSKWTSDRAGRG